MNILITGTAGFIGYHLTKQLTNRHNTLVGLDNINAYYTPQLKYDRLADLGIAQNSIVENTLVKSTTYPNLSFIKCDLENREVVNKLFETQKFDIVVNLAAQAGVREHPLARQLCHARGARTAARRQLRVVGRVAQWRSL